VLLGLGTVCGPLGSGTGGRIVRILPLLFPQAPELRHNARFDAVQGEQLTRHLRGLISQSDAGGVHEDLGLARADRYLIAEAAAHCRDQRLPEGTQAARQDAEHNANPPVVAHVRTIATARPGTRMITAADPCPTTSPTPLNASTGTQVRTK